MADKSISLDIFDDYDIVVNDFCSWEILDPYHDSDSDVFSFSDEDFDPADDVSIKVISQYFGSPSSDVSLVSQSPHQRHLVVDKVISPVVTVTEDLSLNAFVSFPQPAVSVFSQSPPHFKEIAVDGVMPKLDQKNVRIGAVTYDDSEGKYEDDEDEAGNNDLYDDELVPIGVSDKFGKQRIRKSGKNGYGRKKSSKKLPHYSTRPGCVHGKHGLGVQHLIV